MTSLHRRRASVGQSIKRTQFRSPPTALYHREAVYRRRQGKPAECVVVRFCELVGNEHISYCLWRHYAFPRKSITILLKKRFCLWLNVKSLVLLKIQNEMLRADFVTTMYFYYYILGKRKKEDFVINTDQSGFEKLIWLTVL